MNTVSQPKILLLMTAMTGIFSTQAQANLINNGGFELGLAGWTTADQAGSAGTFSVQTGTSSPVNGFPVPAPPEGSIATMTDSEGPGSHVLYQDFVVPFSVGGASIAFSLFLNNGAGDFYNPGHLDFDSPNLNQQARVDIMSTAVDPFSVTVLQNLFQTNPGDPPVSGYNPLLFDITGLLQAHQGETLRLRFAETDNVFFFNFGVDNVNLSTQVTEPSSLIMSFGGLAGLAWQLRRRRVALPG
ncbi:MAG: MYXO-CTERM sorting domain-containing protein [Methylobacter sp.]